MGVIVVLTSDYLILLDESSKEILDYQRDPFYYKVICTPNDDILISNDSELYFLNGRALSEVHKIDGMPMVENIEFLGFRGNILEIEAETIMENWIVKIFLDCDTLKIISD